MSEDFNQYSQTKNMPNLQVLNYDETPIIIEDFMPTFALINLVVMSCIAYGGYILSHLIMGKTIDTLHLSISFSIMVAPSLYFLLSKVGHKNEIEIKNNYITRISNNEKTIIDLDNVVELKKTFIDYYSSDQNLPEISKLFYPISFPIMLFLHAVSAVTKFIIYHIADSFNHYRFYDSIIFITKDETVITVMMRNKKEFEAVKRYFEQQHSINIDNLHTFYKTMYGFEGMRKKRKSR